MSSFVECLPITFLQYCKKNQMAKYIPIPERNVMTFLLRDFNYSEDYKAYYDFLSMIREKKYPDLMLHNFVKLWGRYVCDVC